jgi:hypothetical protein
LTNQVSRWILLPIWIFYYWSRGRDKSTVIVPAYGGSLNIYAAISNDCFLVMLAKLRFSTIQTGLVLFWAIWLTLVTLTNFADAMRQLDVLPGDFKLASYNFDLVKKTVGTHGIPTSVAGVLFAGVILWELLGSILFWRAWRLMRRHGNGAAAEVAQAFAVSLALWAAFLIATEATVNYETAATHKTTLIAQLASLLVVRASASPTKSAQAD